MRCLRAASYCAASIPGPAMTILNCLPTSYDYPLLGIAIAICTIGSWTGIKTFIRARFRPESEQGQWTTISTIAIASTAWTTHFLGMLAHVSHVPTGWDVPITLLSLVSVTLSTALGVMIGSRRTMTLSPELGGLIVGLGIVAMHYIGMMSYDVQARFLWNVPQIVASVAIGLFFGVVALSRASRPVTRFCKYGGTAALVLCILGLHLTGMAALTIVPDQTVVLTGSVTTALFGYGVAGVAAVMIASMLAIYEIDKKTGRKSESRLRRLANATTEGIVIAEGAIVIDVNERFLALTGYTESMVVGQRSDIFWDRAKIDRVRTADDGIDDEIVAADGTIIPIRVLCTRSGDRERIYAFRDLRAKRAVEAQLIHLATHDTLTGAINRGHFTSIMDAMIRIGEPFAVLYIDIDGFKGINDGKGHAMGDAVLVEMSRRMTATLPEATVARIGGDEFALLQPLGSAASDGAERLAAALSLPFSRDGVTIKLGASIGVAAFPRDSRASDVLLGHADLAMYAAKADGGSRTCHYTPEMGERAQRRRILCQDLAAATVAGEIQLHYQVQTSVKSGTPIGFEALARWNHPTLGLIAPDEFIPLAEETGAIIEIGRHVLRQACFDAANWPDELTVAVNLSPAQFKDDVPGLVRAALSDSGLKPTRLELEITESLLIQDPDRVLEILRTLKAMGPRIAMDDFGTGYSSLQTLNIFPFDKIKIDRSFVDKTERSPQAAAIVRAVVNLGHSLAIPVLAEGVEKPEHLEYLKQLGCADAQGYLMGRPTPEAGTAAFMTPNVSDDWNRLPKLPPLPFDAAAMSRAIAAAEDA